MRIGREVLLIVVLLVLIALLVKLIEFFKVDVVEADARAFVLEELSTKYPTADIEIMAVTPKYNEFDSRYFELKAKVTQNPQTPCPQRSHVFYSYPVQNFVSQPAEVITSGCTVCTSPICTIAFPEEAIIASHTLDGTSAVHSYITTYSDALPQVAEESDSWYVTWDSDTSDYYYSTKIHRSGSVLNVTRYER
ncbi:hypothetical protein KKB44_03805 [Candidatus Micrarchaeota archaeon]|nr:hypothetical protein [Candidatus Micrarchaeota archaeon]